ncbi:uncharacterized protein LOC113316618 [Papaver somniferum]|uniref:uncharacterized protein LOC113316618 n=1 Tax=Papaver somniferum TaxID=3469 RepID=UPI000E6F9C45|nr:uncharacterized protein LOC113316618 [Papaver somniferum]
MGSNKAPGIDGFTYEFFKSCWNTLKEDIMFLFKDFHRLKSKKPDILCKIDMEKAFDNVNWNFLFTILKKHYFGDKWISWIRWCVSSSNLSVLVNGSSTLVVEILSKSINDAVERWQITGFKVVEQGTIISHLQFSDDTLIFIDTSVEEVRRLLIILAVFETLTGLKLNLEESIMISIGVEEVINFLAIELGCKT